MKTFTWFGLSMVSATIGLTASSCASDDSLSTGELQGVERSAAESPLPVHWDQTCVDDAECRLPRECALGQHCQESIKLCVYSMRDVDLCVCVENEKWPCTLADGTPGTRTCQRVQALHTRWSACTK